MGSNQQDEAKESLKMLWVFSELLAALVAVVVLVPLRGLVLQLLWQWFLTPVSSTPAPGLMMCVGIALAVSWLVGAYKTPVRESTEEETSLRYSNWRLLFTAVGYHGFVLCVAWLLLMFV